MKDRIHKFLNNCNNEKGITLIEMIITIVVVSIIVTSTLPFFKGSVSSYINVRDGKSNLQSARIGFNRMMAELQQLEASVDIYTGRSTRIRFNIPDDGYGSITYRLNDDELQREGENLVQNVQGLTFTYYKEDGTTKSTPFYYDSDVWRIQVEIEVGDPENPLTLRGQVSPRNIHYN